MHEITTQLVALADYKKVRRVDGFERISSEYPIRTRDATSVVGAPALAPTKQRMTTPREIRMSDSRTRMR